MEDPFLILQIQELRNILFQSLDEDVDEEDLNEELEMYFQDSPDYIPQDNYIPNLTPPAFEDLERRLNGLRV